MVLTAMGGCRAASLLTGNAPSLGSFFWAREQESPLHARPHGPMTDLVLADFNIEGHRTNAGEAFGAWDSDPGDQTQFCRVRLVESEREGESGYGLMLEYDVDSPNPAFNGFWMKLPQIPIRHYEALLLSIKGDASLGFTRRLRLELKGRSQVARFELSGIEADWKRIRIPLSEFDGIGGLREATELVIVFDDETVTERVGTLYIDNVVLEPAA